MNTKKIALISVFNKEGIVDFAKGLVELGFEIHSSGGTAKKLLEAGITVKEVGHSILDHRVATLYPEVHAGLLSLPKHETEMQGLGYPTYDLVCVDLYPMKDAIAKPGATAESVRELTDIGGPTLLRSAAKGNRIVICDPADRTLVLGRLRVGTVDDDFKRNLAAKAEAVIAEYCLASAIFQSGGEWSGIIGQLALACKYGENASQTPAAMFTTHTADPLALSNFTVVAGTAPSYNNLCDLDRLLQTLTHIAATFDLNRGKVPFIAVAVKHGNPCGAGFSWTDPAEAVRNAVDGDRRAILGCFFATNFSMDESLAEILLSYNLLQGETRRLADGVVAPAFTDEAIDMLKRKGDKCRFIVNPALADLTVKSLDTAPRLRFVRGGFLQQPNYTYVLNLKDPEMQKYGPIVTEEQEDNLLLAWGICVTSNSNTTTKCGNGKLKGNGVGQQDRVTSFWLAYQRGEQAGHECEGDSVCTDSFPPFADGPLVAAEHKAAVIFATTGSVRDAQVAERMSKTKTAYWTLPDIKARGFFGH